MTAAAPAVAAPAAGVAVDEMQRRLRAVRRPRPMLDRARERGLTDRQRQLLDQMERLFADGFANLTMAELASRLNCSLRTLYALAPSRDELVLIVVDRNLWRIGRAARDVIGPDLAPLDALRAYLEAATVAVSGWTEAFARDLTAVPAAQRIEDGHNRYVFEVTCTVPYETPLTKAFNQPLAGMDVSLRTELEVAFAVERMLHRNRLFPGNACLRTRST